MKLMALGLALALAGASPALARDTLQQRVEAKLAEAGPGARFGLVVADAEGREIVSVSPEGRFIPGSVTKMFTTAAAFRLLGPLDAPDAAAGASARFEGPDVVLEGRGDARLSSAPDCVQDCLAALADAVAARTKKVRNVVGDDRWFPDERWSPGMSWNNIPTRSGTGISALTVDDNELVVRIAPAAAAGQPARVESVGYYGTDNRVVTGPAGSAADVRVDRMPGEKMLHLTGSVPAGAAPTVLRLGIDDPADYAASRFKALLGARGVRVSGAALARHRPLLPSDDPQVRKGAPPERLAEVPALARLTPPPLLEDLRLTSKVSQNVHAELLLRRVGRRAGSGSIADGVAAVRAMLAEAGVARTDYDFSDGSGMSSYNRVAPRGAVTFLRWTTTQPWGAAWRATLPVAGVDGTLTNRFKGGTLQGKLFAKTGTLNASNGLAGFLIAKSGRTLIFAALANDVPEGISATKAMDAALELIASEN